MCPSYYIHVKYFASIELNTIDYENSFYLCILIELLENLKLHMQLTLYFH